MSAEGGEEPLRESFKNRGNERIGVIFQNTLHKITISQRIYRELKSMMTFAYPFTFVSEVGILVLYDKFEGGIRRCKMLRQKKF